MIKIRNIRLNIFFVIAISFSLLYMLSTVVANRAENLYNFARSKKTVAVHIGEFTKSDKAEGIDVEDIINAFEAGLKNRKSVIFNIVKNIEDADLSVTGDIVRFVYSEKDPIDLPFPPVATVMDIIRNQNYARLEFRINVVAPAKKKIHWKKFLKATLTESDMSRQESIPRIVDRAAYVFIKECFGKPKR